jgi:hypothetical protein
MNGGMKMETVIEFVIELFGEGIGLIMEECLEKCGKGSIAARIAAGAAAVLIAVVIAVPFILLGIDISGAFGIALFGIAAVIFMCVLCAVIKRFNKGISKHDER